MLDIFNSREIAVGLWSATFLVWVFSIEKVRSLVPSLFKTFFVRQIQIAVWAAIFYIMVLTYVLYALGLWDSAHLKNTILWAGGSLVLFVAEAPKSLEERGYYRRAIAKHFQLIVVLEFIVGFRTGPIWLELIVVPIATLLVVLVAVGERKEEHALVVKVANNVLLGIGIIVLAIAIIQILSSWSDIDPVTTLNELVLPPLMSLLFLPCVFVLGSYCKYENSALRMQLLIKDPTLRGYALRKALIKFCFRSSLFDRWLKRMQLTKPSSKSEIDEVFVGLITQAAREKDPPIVNFADGWSPYRACKFLGKKDLYAQDYRLLPHGLMHWSASGSRGKLFEGSLNSLSYSVEGDEHVATDLELSLAIYDNFRIEESRDIFLELVTCLLNEAIGEAPTNSLISAIKARQEFKEPCRGKWIIISQSYFPDMQTTRFAVRNEERSLIRRLMEHSG